MGKINVKFQPGFKGKSGVSVNLCITGLANLSKSNRTTRYVTTTGIYLNDFSEAESNTILSDIKTKINKAIEVAQVNSKLSEFTKNDIRTIIDIATQKDSLKLKKLNLNEKTFVGPKNKKEYTAKLDSISDCINLYVGTKGGYDLGVNNNDVKEGTLKNFRVLKMHLEESNTTSKLSEINEEFIDKLVNHFTTKGLSKSTYIKYLKSLKQVMKFAVNKKIGLSDNRYFEEIKPDLKDINEVQTENIFSLTLDEVSTIYHFKDFHLTSNPERAEIARDIFVFMCMTGTRISDMKISKRFQIEGIDQINFISNKTGAICNVPLNETAKSILEKYENMRFKGVNDGLLPYIPDSDVNQFIKEIGCALNWIEKYPIYSVKTGDTKKQMIKTESKYNRLMTKVGRKTFATLLDDEGFEGPAHIMMGYKPKGIFHRHYSDKKKMMPKLLKAVKALEV